jgi:hypothetical protein
MLKNPLLKSFLLIALCLTGLSSHCQVWVDKGAVWHYHFWGITHGGFQRTEYSKDTMILGKMCQELQILSYDFEENSSHVIFLARMDTLPERYTSVNGDTVFYLNDGHFNVLYNFGAQPGDTWDLGINSNQRFCTSSFVVVDSIGTDTINGHALRWLKIHSSYHSSAGFEGKIYERFGASEPYLFPMENFCDSTVIADTDIFSFSCYEDNSFTIYNPKGTNCERWLSVKEIQNEISSFILFPNPVTDYLKVIADPIEKINEVQIINSQGIKVLVARSKLIDLRALPAGIYSVILNKKSGEIISQRVVKN